MEKSLLQQQFSSITAPEQQQVRRRRATWVEQAATPSSRQGRASNALQCKCHRPLCKTTSGSAGRSSASGAAKKAGAKADEEARMFEPKASFRASRFGSRLFGNPRRGRRRRGRLSLVTFFGEAKKVTSCRATPGKYQRSEAEQKPTERQEGC